MNQKARFFGIWIGTLALLAPNSQAAQDAPPAKPASAAQQKAWKGKMRDLYRTLSSLMTDVSSEARFKNPKNRARIEFDAKRLSELAHDLKSPGAAPADQDPSIVLFSSLFSDSARAAYRSLKAGQTEYSRELLRSLPGYCIACHTRNTTGPSFTSLPIEPTSKDLKALERGEFFASTRQYDRAMDEFQAVIQSRDSASSNPIEWGRAIKYALAIAVRVKKSPEQAQRLVQQILDNKQAPFFMKEDAKEWLKTIETWKKEPARTLTGEEGLYSEAVRLLGQAHTLQKYPVDHSADIVYLRASAAVHDLLQLGPDTRRAGEGYLMAGICYEVLRPFRIGELQELYYEACVRTQKHSPTAAACYHRYEESVYFNYSGSSGTHLPEDERSKLKLLEALAMPEPLTQP